MASLDSVAEDLSSLDGKVNSILDYLKTFSKNKDTTDNPFSAYIEQRDSEDKKEDNKLRNLKRKKRLYQAIPVALDSLTTDGKNELTKALKGIIPEPSLIQAPIEKAFKWLPLLLAGLTALGAAFYLFKDKILEYFKDFIPNVVKAFITDFLPKFIDGLVIALGGAKAAASAVKTIAPASSAVKDYQNIAKAAAQEATTARRLATQAAFGVEASGKITPSRSKDLDRFIRTTIQSVEPAERAKLQAIIREWNIRTLTMSTEELQGTLFNLYKSGLKTDDVYAKSLAELIRLKELGLTAQEIQELSKIAKPTIYSFAVETRRTLFEQAVYNLRTIPKEMYQTARAVVQEAYRSPFTKEEYAKLIKPVEGFINNIFTSIGDRLSAAKGAIMESAPVKKALDISSKIVKTFSWLDKWVLEPLFVALGSIEVAQTISSEIEKYGYKFATVSNAWLGSLASVFSFGIVTLTDIKEQANKEYEAFKKKNYAEVFMRELFSIPDLYNKFIYGLGENISKLFGQEELSKQFAELRKTADLTAWYNNILNKVYNWIYNIVDFVTFGKGVQKPKSNEIKPMDTASINIPSTNDTLYYDKALKAHVEIIKESNKEVVKTLKEDKGATAKLSESILSLSKSLAENSNNVNMVNNSRNQTNISITPTTSVNYRETRLVFA